MKGKSASYISHANRPLVWQRPGIAGFDRRDKRSVIQAMWDIRKFMRKNSSRGVPLNWRTRAPTWKINVAHIATFYWHIYERSIANPARVKQDAKLLKRYLDVAADLIGNMPVPLAAKFLNQSPLDMSDTVDVSALKAINEMRSICSSVVEEEAENVRAEAVGYACYELKELFEQIFERPFKNHLKEASSNTSDGARSVGLREFVSLDAFFIQTALQAIDPGVSFYQIRYALMPKDTLKHS